MKARNEWKLGKATLALGEVTGHSHRFENAVKHRNGSDGLACALLLERPEVLVHEEHDPVTIGEGEFEVVLQREYDVLEGVRQVLD